MPSLTAKLLYAAASHGDIDQIRTLMPDVENLGRRHWGTKRSGRRSPLHIAAVLGKHEALEVMLTEGNFDVNGVEG